MPTNTNTKLPQEELTPESQESALPSAGPKKSRESLFGGLLLAAMVIFVLFVIAGVAWAIWGGVNHTQSENKELSIAALGDAAEQVVEEVKEAVSPESTTTPDAPSGTGSKSVSISVLNGGAAGGSAGKLATAIKADGYTQVAASDSTGDYTGVVIYHSEESAQDAQALKTVVAKTYPNVTTAVAIVSNNETRKTPLVVIIGR